jgi:hypothetical protein
MAGLNGTNSIALEVKSVEDEMPALKQFKFVPSKNIFLSNLWNHTVVLIPPAEPNEVAPVKLLLVFIYNLGIELVPPAVFVSRFFI